MNNSLDLTTHSIADVPGKRVSINGCPYVFESLMAEGAEAFVYPLRNERSGLIWFVGKIFKYRPGTPQAEKKQRDIPILSFTKKHQVELAQANVRMLHTEFYETGGAIVIFQEHVGTERPNHEAFCEPLVKTAHAAVEALDLGRAIRVYDQILEHNPRHSHALQNKAGCLASLHREREALTLLEEARDIEPNDPWSYRTSAGVLCRIGRFEEALTVLEKALARCPWDLESWLAAMRIATRFDFPEKATELFASVEEWLVEGTLASEWRPEIESCRERRRDYDNLLGRALDLQKSYDFATALPHCEAAMAKSENNIFARVNRAVCMYHLGQGAECLEDLTRLSGVLTGLPWLSWAGLTMLCAHEAGDYKLARGLAVALAQMLDNHWDLPTVPTHIAQESVLEGRSTQAVEVVVRDLLTREDDPSAKGDLAGLLNLYSQRAGEDTHLPKLPRRGWLHQLIDSAFRRHNS